jgi:hypothetical protein
MTKQEFKEFMGAQVKEIKRYKWNESEKEGHDLGNECCLKWINKFAKKFKDDYYKSRGWKK